MQAPSPMTITCEDKWGTMTDEVRKKLVTDLVGFLNSVKLEEFKWNLKSIDAEGLKEEHACTAIGTVKNRKFNVGFVLFKRVDPTGNANDDSMESMDMDMDIGKVLKKAIEQEKQQRGLDMDR